MFTINLFPPPGLGDPVQKYAKTFAEAMSVCELYMAEGYDVECWPVPDVGQEFEPDF